MSRSWLSYIFVLAVVGGFAVLGMLQFQWQARASEADREKLQRRVETDTARFAEDFNREIQSAYLNFQLPADAWLSGDHSHLVSRYDYWQANAPYPELIESVYFIESEKPANRYDPADRAFKSAADDVWIREVNGRLSEAPPEGPVIIGSDALVVPVTDVGPLLRKVVIREIDPAGPRPIPETRPIGNLVIKLDLKVIADEILPALVRKYFADGEYGVSVVDNEGNAVLGSIPEAADAKAALLDLSPDRFVMFAARERTDVFEREQTGVVVHQRVKKIDKLPNGQAATGVFTMDIKTAGDTGGTAALTRVQNDSAGLWTLQVQHSSGSIDRFVQTTFYRNLALGGGIIGLLAVSIIAIFFSAQRAKTAAQRQVDFVSSVSHEFRTPLAVISSAGDNLADGVAAEQVQVANYGELIKKESRKLSAMVEQILEFAGARSGRLKYKLEKTDAKSLIDEALADCRALLDEKNIEVRTDVPETLPAVYADRNAMARVLQNLIANAVKYSNGAGRIGVSAESGGGNLKITVSDNGIGISKADLRRIFEPFYRARSVVDAQIHGNGLGLSLVKRVVETHNGQVFVESEPGSGSRFTVVLPVIQ